MTSKALIGHTGFVGQSLLRQGEGFSDFFRSSNSADMRGRTFDLVYCAGASATKWQANADPEADKDAIETLIANIDAIQCETFVLISTVDVFSSPVDVDEDTAIDEKGLEPYGRHRRMLEVFVASRFSESCIVRLPGLVGSGLKKNVIFDMAHENEIAKINPAGRFQFYPMARLWADIERALAEKIPLLHLTAEPIDVGSIAKSVFGLDLSSQSRVPASAYDFKSKYARAFGGRDGYMYGRSEVMRAIQDYAQGVRANRDGVSTN